MLPDYARAPHTDLICDRLEAVERGEVRRLVIACPPQHGKSTNVSRLFPAWVLGRDPRRSIVLASYGSELAEGHSRAARALLTSERFPVPDVRLSSDSTAVGRWHTTAGGGMLAVGVGGGLTGWGCDIAIVDDPIKDRQEADSETIREATWGWFQEVLLTRLRPGGAVVLMGTRWHPDDVIGTGQAPDQASSGRQTGAAAHTQTDHSEGTHKAAGPPDESHAARQQPGCNNPRQTTPPSLTVP